MSDGLRVDHAALEAAAQDLRVTVAAIGDRLHRLHQELAPLRADWTGQAQEAYLAAQGTWDAALEEMRLLLEQTSHAVQRSNEDYRAADLRGAAAFGAG